MPQYKVSVIIPALNEENGIHSSIMDVLKAFERLGIQGEIIVVNDGSSDQTGKIVENLSREYSMIRMIEHDRPKGIGLSYWDGVKQAEGEFVTWVSGEGESRALDILSYLPLMENVDIVIPYVFNDRMRRPFLEIARSKLFNLIVNISFRFMIHYTNGNVIYRKCVLEDIHLTSQGFFFQTELLIKCLKKGYLFAEVPIAGNRRSSGEPKSFQFRSVLNVMRDYLLNLVRFYSAKRENKPLSPLSVTAKRLQECFKI